MIKTYINLEIKTYIKKLRKFLISKHVLNLKKVYLLKYHRNSTFNYTYIYYHYKINLNNQIKLFIFEHCRNNRPIELHTKPSSFGVILMKNNYIIRFSELHRNKTYLLKDVKKLLIKYIKTKDDLIYLEKNYLELI